MFRTLMILFWPSEIYILFLSFYRPRVAAADLQTAFREEKRREEEEEIRCQKWPYASK